MPVKCGGADVIKLATIKFFDNS